MVGLGRSPPVTPSLTLPSQQALCIGRVAITIGWQNDLVGVHRSHQIGRHDDNQFGLVLLIP